MSKMESVYRYDIWSSTCSTWIYYNEFTNIDIEKETKLFFSCSTNSKQLHHALHLCLLSKDIFVDNKKNTSIVRMAKWNHGDKAHIRFCLKEDKKNYNLEC
jgi:hypothetical protein